MNLSRTSVLLFLALLLVGGAAWAQAPAPARPAKAAAQTRPALPFPPTLPGGQAVVTDSNPLLLERPAGIAADVAVALTPPTIDFLYFSGQNYPGKPWSAWGDSLAVGGKYYASIADHLSPLTSGGDPERGGSGLIFEYDPLTKTLRPLLEVRKLLNLPPGHYLPGKIHGRLDLGSDGWLYFSTHRGSTRATTDAFHYQGDWIIRVNPVTAAAEVVVQGPVPKHCIPTSVVDPQRLIFYGGSAPGDPTLPETSGDFFAYDLQQKKLLFRGPNGPNRYLMLANSTGRVYYVAGGGQMTGPLLRYDPSQGGPPVQLDVSLGLRAATAETPQGFIYTVSSGSKGKSAQLYAFNTKTEEVQPLGAAEVGVNSYITTLDADPTGRYLYYVPGAHGGSEHDGTAVVQFDLTTRKKKVLAFLHPYYRQRYGVTLVGTYSLAVDPSGDKLYITWNASRNGRLWDCCALTVIHIPASEREP